VLNIILIEHIIFQALLLRIQLKMLNALLTVRAHLAILNTLMKLMRMANAHMERNIIQKNTKTEKPSITSNTLESIKHLYLLLPLQLL